MSVTDNIDLQYRQEYNYSHRETYRETGANQETSQLPRD